MFWFQSSLGKVRSDLTSLFNKHEHEGERLSMKETPDPAVDAAKQAREIAQVSGVLANAIAKLGSPQSDMDEVSGTITRENLKLIRMIQKNLKLT